MGHVDKLIYIPIEVVIAHIAGISTDGDPKAAKRIFALSARGNSTKGANAGFTGWLASYPGLRDAPTSSQVEAWSSGTAWSVGQFAADVIDFRSQSGCRDKISASKTDCHGRNGPGAASERIEMEDPTKSNKEQHAPGIWPRSGRTRELRRNIEKAMLEALDSGTLSLEQLVSATEKELAAWWKVSRTPPREARKAVLAQKDASLNAALRIFEQHAREGAISLYQPAPSGARWAIPRGLWRPGSLRRWADGLVLHGSPLACGKIYPNLEIRLNEAKRQYSGFDPGAVGCEPTEAGIRRRRGPRPEKSKAVENAMYEKIRRGTLSIDALREIKEESLAAEYRCSRTTVRRARKSVLTTIRPAE